MIYVELKNKQYRKYFESEDGFVTGTAFTKDGQMLSGETLMDYLASFGIPEDLAQNLPELNGFYAFALKKGNRLIAAVDRIRSIPLFYGQKGDDFFMSDSADWVRSQVRDDKIDPIAKEEFLLCGYVTGPDTLFPEVKQLQAGEAIIVGQDIKRNLQVNPQRYFRYLPSMDSPESEEEIFHQLDAVLDRVFKRLIDYADGRTIVVPLSGGYDSRLIVLMLKRLGYGNIVAFSYGKPGNKEAMVSKEVAEKLGIRWEFVPYSNEQWYEWYRSSEMKDFFEFAGNLSSLPHIQDWPAVKALKEDKKIPENAVFVPGHTVVLAIQINAVEAIWKKEKGQKAFFEMLRKSHYNLWQFKINVHELRNASYSADFQMDTKEQVAAVGDSWAWTERQSKFIGNSIRTYEFFRYDWWMPFWDREFVDYWSGISYENRLSKSLFKRYVNDLATRQGLEIKEKDSSNLFTRDGLVSIAKRVLPEKVKNRLRKIREIHSFKKHPMAWYGIHEDGDVQEKIRNGATMINSLLAIDYIDGISETRL